MDDVRCDDGVEPVELSASPYFERDERGCFVLIRHDSTLPAMSVRSDPYLPDESYDGRKNVPPKPGGASIPFAPSID
ncbi:hypothetical protein GCM10010411_35690 [Actinomadura fulvescens]|uniref:Uncharacterized protein n=1 Tax=Actinomadura fulvescens TaxID=46160 RepID=A0ABP6C2F5_9ACTN